jgi:hypothetical protein
MQEDTSQPQQYIDAYAQHGRFADAHEDMTQDGRYLHAEKTS